ncbi:uncharacterized protein LOC100176248 [Ciona intestinalis]
MHQTTFFANSFEEVLHKFDLSSNKCPLCEENEISYKTDLKKHLNYVHFRYAIFQKVDGKQGIILPCRRSCFHRISLKEVKRSHYHCPFCQRCYGRGNSFKVHLKSQEGRCSLVKKNESEGLSNQELEVWIGTEDQDQPDDIYLADGSISADMYNGRSDNSTYSPNKTMSKSPVHQYDATPSYMVPSKRKRQSVNNEFESHTNVSIAERKFDNVIGTNSNDAEDLFFASIAAEVKTLPKKTKSELKLKILSLVNDSVQSLENNFEIGISS